MKSTSVQLFLWQFLSLEAGVVEFVNGDVEKGSCHWVFCKEVSTSSADSVGVILVGINSNPVLFLLSR